MRTRGTTKIFVGLVAMIMVLSVLCVNAFAADNEVDEYTVSLIHFDGENGSTSIIDEMGKNWYIVNSNLAELSTSDPKFGTSCLSSTVAAYIMSSHPASDDFNFSDEDFTVEMWVKPTSLPTGEEYSCLYSNGYNNTTRFPSIMMYIDPLGNLKLSASTSKGTFNVVSGGICGTVPVNQWSHIALVRDGSSIKCAVNGIFGESYAISDALFDLEGRIYLGGRGSGGYLIGSMDEVRISKGIARYTDNFIPPDQPFGSKVTEPTNLTAISSDSSIILSWDAVEDATSYNIKRSITEGGPYTTIATGITDTAYTDTTVTNSTTYYYVVSAVVDSGESANSNEASATPQAPAELDVTLDVVAVDKAKIGDEIIADVVIYNADTICAEDIRIVYDTELLEYLGAEAADSMKIYKEAGLGDGTNRYITASLGKDNAANGDKVLFHLKFRAKAAGEAKVDIVRGRIADNATLEVDVDEENCGETTIIIEGIKDINRTGEFTLLDLGIAAWYYGDPASATDTTKYDVDVIADGIIDDNDLSEAVVQMLDNANYSGNN